MRAALFIVTAVVFSMGLIMIYNTTSAEAMSRDLNLLTQWALIKQVTYALFGLALSVFIYSLGYEKILSMTPQLMTLFTLFLALLLIPGIAPKINGARRWFIVGPLSFQPSEFMKIVLPLYYVHSCLKRKTPHTLYSFLKLMVKLAVPMGLILLEPDNGTVAILMALLCVLFFLTKIKLRYWALPLTGLVLVGATLAAQMPHVKQRINIYLHPELDLLGRGHQPYQAKIAIGSGGLLGRGLGESLQKQGYLPEARSDYIAAIYAEEFGFMGILALISLYALMSFFGFQLAARSKNPAAFYSAAILTFLLTFQAFLNLAIVSGLLPSKGTNLPFFSQGGSSLLSNMIILALIFSVEKEEVSYA